MRFNQRKKRYRFINWMRLSSRTRSRSLRVGLKRRAGGTIGSTRRLNDELIEWMNGKLNFPIGNWAFDEVIQAMVGMLLVFRREKAFLCRSHSCRDQIPLSVELNLNLAGSGTDCGSSWRWLLRRFSLLLSTLGCKFIKFQVKLFLNVITIDQTSFKTTLVEHSKRKTNILLIFPSSPFVVRFSSPSSSRGCTAVF